MKNPDQVCLVLTTKCNLRCINCRSWEFPQRDEMTPEQVAQLLDSLRGWLGASTVEGRERRAWELYFAGGEPFVRQDMVPLLERCRDQDIWAQITTNGTLIDEALARRILAAAPGAIGLSLDGSRAETHDHLKGRDGAFAKTWRALETLATLKLETKARTAVQVHVLLSGYHTEEVLELLDRIEPNPGVLNLVLQALTAPFFQEVPERWWESSPFWPRDLDAFDRVLDELLERKRASDAAGRCAIGNSEAQLELIRRYFHDPEHRVPGRCTVDEHSFNIDSNGDVRICHFMEPVGNVLQSAPEAIWTGERAAAVRRKIAGCRHNCSLMNCNWFDDGLEGAEALLAGWDRQ